MASTPAPAPRMTDTAESKPDRKLNTTTSIDGTIATQSLMRIR